MRPHGGGEPRMRRREFIMLLGGAAGWPFVAYAQRAALPVIGFLNGGTPEGYAELGPKRLQLLHEFVPGAAMMAVLINPKSRNADIQSREIEAAAATLGLQLHVLHASSEGDFEMALATADRLGAGGLVISADPLFNASVNQLAALALRHRMPAIYQYREFAAAGALTSYGGSITDQYRLVGVYTGRILKGEKPGDLPVQQATKLE